MNDLINNSNSRKNIEVMLGLDEGALSGGDLIKIDIPNPLSRNLRLPDPITRNDFYRPNTGLTIGNKTRVDGLIRNSDGTYSIEEDKLHDLLNLTKGQKAAKDHVVDGNGIFEVRSEVDDFGLNKDAKIKVKQYNINYKEVTKGE